MKILFKRIKLNSFIHSLFGNVYYNIIISCIKNIINIFFIKFDDVEKKKKNNVWSPYFYYV